MPEAILVVTMVGGADVPLVTRGKDDTKAPPLIAFRLLHGALGVLWEQAHSRRGEASAQGRELDACIFLSPVTVT